jgi:NitT/TauT family transport system ATP-binding protein
MNSSSNPDSKTPKQFADTKPRWNTTLKNTLEKQTTPGLDPILQAQELSAVFPNKNGGLQALDQVSFSVAPRQFICVLGPSGSGKSTLLRILGGLLPPTSGRILFDGSPIKGPSRRVGLVFQDSNLMPWRTVIENITLPLEVKRVSKVEAVFQALELVKLVGLGGFEDWMPRNLSGGMAQRVAIARALIYDPDVLLLDEPFGALDALTRERMALELLRIWRFSRKTVIMVTHSIPEALLLADRILVLTSRPGKICLDMPVGLPRPRNEGTRYTSEFNSLSRQLRGAIAADP